MSGIKVKFDTLRTVTFASVTTGYNPVGAAFSNPVRILKIDNTTDANLFISFNGIDNQLFIAAKSFVIFDYCSNRSEPSGSAEQSAGERVYVKLETAAPTLGNVYCSVVYVP